MAIAYPRTFCCLGEKNNNSIVLADGGAVALRQSNRVWRCCLFLGHKEVLAGTEWVLRDREKNNPDEEGLLIELCLSQAV